MQTDVGIRLTFHLENADVDNKLSKDVDTFEFGVILNCP